MSELVTMYPAQANSPETSLSGALTAAGTTVNVVDGSVLPEAPNLLTIGADGRKERERAHRHASAERHDRPSVVGGRRYRPIFHSGRPNRHAGEY